VWVDVATLLGRRSRGLGVVDRVADTTMRLDEAIVLVVG